jgi:outer membrane autotransporter protein
VGYDRQGSNFLFGATVGYAYNYIHVSESLGHGQLQEEMLSLYGSYYTNHFWIAGAIWGGIYQLNNERHTLVTLTSRGKIHGWILDPHLELASPWALDCHQKYYIEPFVLFDWVANWQDDYTETGSSGFNLKMPNQFNSLLQTEAGLRFYECLAYGWGEVRLEEKVSYVNQAPFDFHSVTTSFVASTSSFPIAVGSSKMQNLGAAQILATFVPKNCAAPYGGFSFQVTGNGEYQSYFATLFGGKDF